ncbi:MAG TPA: FtsX-like permease family protein, partial [Longimicrobiales bacterium]|nr:FtsX-like permease family protein [Longimicrobiales bacterium]
LGLSIIAGLFFGTIPVVRVLRGSLTSVFREQGRTGTASRKALAVRGGLVVAQVSTAFALLIAAGLMIASFLRTLQVETGFTAENLITASVALSPTRYTNAEQRTAAQEQILARVRAIPGVAAAGATDVLPFTSDRNSSAFSPADYVPQPGESVYAPVNSAVSPGYFEAMGIELVRGRWFDHTDTRQSQRVFVIDEWLANRYWPGQDPIGKQAFEGVRGIGLDDDIELRTIVGVVKNVRVAGYNGDQPNGHFYYAAPQRSIARFYVVIRTRVEPTSLVGALRAAVTGYDPDLPVYDVQTMKERMADSLAADRLRLFLVIGFAFIALFLSAVGLYGVLAYTVTQRTSEMGIRMALGSSAREIFRLVLIHGLRLTAIGLGIGLTASLALSRLIRGLLFNVQPNDPLVFVSVLVVLAVTAALACLLPARRATRIDPLVALKEA